VTFESSTDADTARRAMDGRMVDGRCLEVRFLPVLIRALAYIHKISTYMALILLSFHSFISSVYLLSFVFLPFSSVVSVTIKC